MAPAYLLKYHPLITPRIEFKPAPPPPLPKLTQRTEFHAEELLRSRKRYEEDQDNPARGPKRRRVSFAPDDVDHEDSGNPPSASASAPRKLIPKPPGEPGRPSSGGFSLEETLVDCHGWQKSKFDDLHKLVKTEASNTLDMTLSFSRQDKQKIQEICDKMESVGWSHLADYEECWPVRSMLKLVLKYWVESARRIKDKEASERIRSAMRSKSPDF